MIQLIFLFFRFDTGLGFTIGATMEALVVCILKASISSLDVQIVARHDLLGVSGRAINLALIYCY